MFRISDKQKGSALVVSLMITLVIGVIAVSLAGISYKSQRRENTHYSSDISYNNAMSGINEAKAFLKGAVTSSILQQTVAIISDSEPEITPEDKFDFNAGTLKYKSFKDYFKGIYQELSDVDMGYGSSWSTNVPWYRNSDGFDVDTKCQACVRICDTNCSDAGSHVLTVYRVEVRDFSPVTPSLGIQSANAGYRFYRITSLGLDPNNPNAQTILQTNIGLLDEKN